jgi:hypothetical protein
VLSLFFHIEMEHAVAGGGEKYEKYHQQRYVRPPKRLEYWGDEMENHVLHITYLSTKAKHRQDRSSGDIELNSVLEVV